MERPSTLTWPSVRFSVTVMCGNSSKFWNTMPMRERSFGRLVLGSPTEMPSTVMLPFWKGSSAFTHLISVDLPLPEGPHTTTTSPLATSVEQSVSTWKLPYHLLTLFIEIMGPYRMIAMRCCSRLTSVDSPYDITKYTMATKLYISTRRQSPFAIIEAAPRKPVAEITYTSDVSRNRMMVWLRHTGSMLRKAC